MNLSTPKTDKADAKKMACFALDRWTKLRQYSRMDECRNQLKTMNWQFGFYMDQKTAMKNNLIVLLDQTFPGANSFFNSPARSDGSQSGWILSALIGMWAASAANPLSLSPSTTGAGVNGRSTISARAKPGKFISPLLISSPCSPKDDNTKMLIQQAAAMLNAVSETRFTPRWIRRHLYSRNILSSWRWTA